MQPIIIPVKICPTKGSAILAIEVTDAYFGITFASKQIRKAFLSAYQRQEIPAVFKLCKQNEIRIISARSIKFYIEKNTLGLYVFIPKLIKALKNLKLKNIKSALIIDNEDKLFSDSYSRFRQANNQYRKNSRNSFFEISARTKQNPYLYCPGEPALGYLRGQGNSNDFRGINILAKNILACVLTLLLASSLARLCCTRRHRNRP